MNQKISNKLFMPVKCGKNNRLEYCLDKKQKPRVYKSKENLKKYMNDKYDLIAVYTGPGFIRPIKD